MKQHKENPQAKQTSDTGASSAVETIVMPRQITTDDVIREQTNIPFNENHKFLCRDCKNWKKGTCICTKGIFITAVDCHLPECWGFEAAYNTADNLILK